MRLTYLLVLALLLSSPVSAREPATQFTPAQLREDLETLRAGLLATHPRLSHSVDPRELTGALDTLSGQLDHDMDRDQAWRVLATLNPLLADGHLFVAHPDMRADTRRHLRDGGQLFPFEVALDDADQLRIVRTLDGQPTPLAGTRLLSINGKEINQILSELRARTHGDSPRFRDALLARRWWYLYWKVLGAPEQFFLQLEGNAQPLREVPGSRFLPAMIAGEDVFEQQFQFTLLPDGAALMTVRTFSWPDDGRFRAFTQDAFRRMHTAGTRTLVIDIRDNGGGDDAMWLDHLLPWLADRPFRWASAYEKKVLRDNPEQGEHRGQVLHGTIDSWRQPASNDPLHFHGQTWVIVGPTTYSSAVLFANTVQDFGIGRIAGQGASVRSTQSGGIQRISLPNTGLALWAPRFLLQRPSGATAPYWLTPDLPLREDPLHPQAQIQTVLRAAPASAQP
ncbi:S41 family peptidase [Stenotrophomonas sp. Iso1]|uniref:S41 family peptidase n=1 Tax=Stenotrophomonas sp. Iso1 TaxID=2977283 RepID=UPI0022B77AB8|nr:S41 family peptidase [Stenotrophomonas sp. Iso1]